MIQDVLLRRDEKSKHLWLPVRAMSTGRGDHCEVCVVPSNRLGVLDVIRNGKDIRYESLRCDPPHRLGIMDSVVVKFVVGIECVPVRLTRAATSSILSKWPLTEEVRDADTAIVVIAVAYGCFLRSHYGDTRRLKVL